jgi:hypothetical protein
MISCNFVMHDPTKGSNTAAIRPTELDEGDLSSSFLQIMTNLLAGNQNKMC